MGNYIAQTDLEERIGINRFKNLCNVPEADVPELAEGIIGRAEALIDGFASARFQTPLNKTALVEGWALCIAEYELYKRGPGATVPEKIRDSYRDCVGQLSELAAGRLETGAALSAKTLNVPSPPVITRTDRQDLFSAERMESF